MILNTSKTQGFLRACVLFALLDINLLVTASSQYDTHKKQHYYQPGKVTPSKIPSTTESNLPTTVILISSLFITNNTDYLHISCDYSQVKALVSGYTFGVFGHEHTLNSQPTQLSSTLIGSNINQSKKTKLPQFNLQRSMTYNLDKTSKDSSSAHAASEFNTYSGFMASPGEVLATLVGAPSNGISIESEQYNIYNPFQISSVEDVNWTYIYATVMVAVRVDGVPQKITISNEMITTLAGYLGLSNESIVTSSAAYAIPDEESGPVYDTDVITGSDGFVTLTVDPDWFSGMISSQIRASKQHAAKTNNISPNSSSQEETTNQDVFSTEFNAESKKDLLAVSLNFVVPRAISRDIFDSPPPVSFSDSNSETKSEILIGSNRNKMFVSNTVSTLYLFDHTNVSGRLGNRWIITIIFNCVLIFAISAIGLVISGLQMGYPMAMENSFLDMAHKDASNYIENNFDEGIAGIYSDVEGRYRFVQPLNVPAYSSSPPSSQAIYTTTPTQARHNSKGAFPVKIRS